MVTKQRFAVGDALNVATQVHTSPAMFGKVMSLTQPRMGDEPLSWKHTQGSLFTLARRPRTHS